MGEGDSGFYESMKIITDYNYEGWLVLENFYDREPLSLLKADPRELIKKDIATLHG